MISLKPINNLLCIALKIKNKKMDGWEEVVSLTHVKVILLHMLALFSELKYIVRIGLSGLISHSKSSSSRFRDSIDFELIESLFIPSLIPVDGVKVQV
ncbi:hypothetical protein Syun_002857 [Stephania yunnanensis]|uniref:Uncharacterized protein n=1 Tax=Stephania yunnanensis TaxID=152371 RepID=A0AAP0L2M8_9MAGN